MSVRVARNAFLRRVRSSCSAAFAVEKADSPATIGQSSWLCSWLPRSLGPETVALSRGVRRPFTLRFSGGELPVPPFGRGVERARRCLRSMSDPRASTVGSWNLVDALDSYLQRALRMSRPMARLPGKEFHDLFRLRYRAVEPASGTGPTPRGRLLIPQSQHPSITLARDVTTLAPLPRPRLRQTPLVAQHVNRRGKRSPLLVERVGKPYVDSEQPRVDEQQAKTASAPFASPRSLTCPPGPRRVFNATRP